MTFKNHIVAIIVFVVMLVLVVNTVRIQHKLDAANANAIVLKQDADLKIGRAETLTADATIKIKLMDQEIQDDIKKHQALVNMYSELQAKYEVKGSGTISVPGPVRTIYVTQDGKSVELKSLPFEFKDFRLHANGDAVTKEFKYTLNQNFEIQLAETRDKHGLAQHYAELYEMDSGGQRIGKLEVTKFQVIKSSEVEQAKFRYWDMRLDIGLDESIFVNFDHRFGGELGLSLCSYGKTTGLNWRFIRPYLGINSRDILFGITPALYNIAEPLPVVNNIWVGPSVGRTFDGQYFLSFGVSAIL